jgi:putative tryptophan/tyrosine transport system substrate-binding protein
VITRRNVLLAAGIGLLVAHRPSRGQPATAMRRVGWLSLGSEVSVAHLYAAFKHGMRDFGWLEGKNVEYRFVYADGAVDRLDALAGELIGQNVEVIIVGNPTTASVAQRATKTIPIVMVSVGDPVGRGLVASLAKPGGNITGFTSQQADVLGKLIGILHEITPEARRIAIMLNESSPLHPVFWGAAHRACTALDLVAMRVVASTPAQLGAAVEQVIRQGSQAVVVVPDPIFLNERAKLQALMQATRLPVAYGWREHVVAGGLLSYSADLAASFRDAARYVDKILKGAKPADLPVEQATKFELVLNLKTAKALGLTIPQSVLLQAAEVIR